MLRFEREDGILYIVMAGDVQCSRSGEFCILLSGGLNVDDSPVVLDVARLVSIGPRPVHLVEVLSRLLGVRGVPFGVCGLVDHSLPLLGDACARVPIDRFVDRPAAVAALSA